MKSKKCPMCSHDLISHPQMDAVDKERTVENRQRLRFLKKPEAILFKEAIYGELRPHVCLECGFVAMYVHDQFKSELHELI